MDIKIATDKTQWNNFLKQNPRDGLFLQSWAWGELLAKTGQNVKRLRVVDNGSVVAQVQLVVKKLSFGMFYALAGKGPVVKYQVESITYKVYELIATYLQNNKCTFFRFEPQYLILDTCYLIQEVKDINPPATLLLDIASDEDTLLASMHEKTRYNIRLAEKKGLKVTEEKNFDIFWNLLQKTGERDNFALHSRASYEAIVSSDVVKQIIVWSGETPVATAGLIGFGDTMYYLYGASDHAYRNLMGPHLMQWEAIQLAKKLGFKKYDFFGISPRCHSEPPSQGVKNPFRQKPEGSFGGVDPAQDDSYRYDPMHRYAGVTRFKLGFGGEVHEEPGTFDLIIDKNKYRVYQALRKLRSLF